MYNITYEYSFKDVLYWINKIRNYDDDIPIIIIGNMCDDEERRVIPKDEGEKLGEKYDYHFYESSNKLGINIEEPINDLVEQIIKIRDDKKNKTYKKEISNINLRRKDIYSKIYSKFLNY